MNDGSLWCRIVQAILKNSHSLHGRQQYEAPMHVAGNHMFAHGLRQKQRRNEVTLIRPGKIASGQAFRRHACWITRCSSTGFVNRDVISCSP